MSLHLFGAILTGHGCAANNRGESEGNITTLQKILWNDEVHTTVSAEAIRWAIRYFWQCHGIPVNRRWDDDKDDHVWQDACWKGWSNKDGAIYIDDDLLGYMKAEGAKEEGAKGSTSKRRGALEVTRAISSTPYAGDISFNAKSGEKGRTSLYGAEMHATRYQYAFAMTPERLRVREHTRNALEAIASLGEVAGNHSRFLFDFSPESIVLRLTHDPAPRILYCYHEEKNTVTAPGLVRKVKAGDIKPEELYIGGQIADDPDIQAIGAAVCSPGVLKAAAACNASLASGLGLEQ